MNQLIKHWYVPLVIFIISLPAIYQLFSPGFFFMYDDMQVIRLQQMDLCVKDIQIPCRWVPDLGYGYGYPLFQYYAPVPYYFMELIHLFGFSLIYSVKIGFVASVYLSGLFFYFFARKLLNPIASIAGATLYIYVPIRAADLYVRGAMGELWGLAVIPLVFWSIECVLEKPNRKSLVFLSVALLLFLTTHNLTVLMVSLVIFLWTAIRLFTSDKKNFSRTLKTLLMGGALGFGLSAFFLVPLIAERNDVYLETLTQGYFNYLAHFVSLKQLFFSLHWGYGPSIEGPYDDVSLSVGQIQLGLAVFGLIITLVKSKSRNYKYLALFMSSVVVCFSFLTHQRSTFIWQSIEFIEILQFPWRFLVPIAFASSFLGALVFEFLNKKTLKIVIIPFVIGVISFYISFFQPKDWYLITDEEKLSGQSYQRQVTASIYDYLPKSAKYAPKEASPNSLIVEDGEVTTYFSQKGSNWFRYGLDIKSEDAYVVIPVFDFDDWQVKIDENIVPHNEYGDLGLLGVNITGGNHVLEAKLYKSSSKKMGDLITVISAFILLAVVLRRENEK